MKNLLIIILLTISVSTFGQKFMISGNDTLPYKQTMEVRDGDTVYLGTCWTFEKIKGQIVNQSDDHCLRQGLWIITDSIGNYWTGNYHNNHEDGIWKRFDRNGKLLKETEEVFLGKDSYKVKEIDYASGQPITIIDRAFLSFYIKNFFVIVIIIFGAFFSRVFINSRIYNNENGTNFSPIYFYFPGFVSKNFGHSMLCTFTLWFSNYKPENNRLVIISNALSLIALGTFFGLLIGLAINGELH